MIRLLVLDVDGTMTVGGVYHDSTGNELKKFAIKDGARIVLAREARMQTMICNWHGCDARRRRPLDRRPGMRPGPRAAPARRALRPACSRA